VGDIFETLWHHILRPKKSLFCRLVLLDLSDTKTAFRDFCADSKNLSALKISRTRGPSLAGNPRREVRGYCEENVVWMVLAEELADC
jgi:hypothetical protein